jgi:hypothetical protein
MMKMTIIEELERKVHFVESEIEGEKRVTRAVLEQSIRNGDQLGALRSEVATGKVDIQGLTSRVDHIAIEVIQNTAALRNHGTLLTMLQADVGALRNDVTALRRGQEELHARLDTELSSMREEAARQHDELLASVREEVARQHNELLASVREEVTARHNELREEVARRHNELLASVREEVASRHHELLSAIQALGSGAAPPA